MPQVQTIRIENYKAISELEINLQGRSAYLIGANGSGKTTVGNLVATLLLPKMRPGTPSCPWPNSFGWQICEIHNLIPTDIEWFRHNNGGNVDWGIRLGWLISAVEAICSHHKINLSAHIEAKLAYNATRPAKHGKLY